MAYIDSLQKVSFVVDGVQFDAVGGSFRGVPFFVEDYERNGGGRRISTRSVPFSNDFYHEDLGGEVPSYSFNIFLVGEECDKVRDNLIAVCSEEGPGELIHPYFGKFDARCTSLSFGSSKTDLGYVRGQITFVPERAQVFSVVNLQSAAEAKAEAAEKTFVEKFLDGARDFRNTAKSVLDKAAEITDKALDAVNLYRSVLSEVNDFVNEIGRIKANVDRLLASPADFAARIVNLVNASAEIFGIETDPEDDVQDYAKIIQNKVDAETGTLGRYVADLVQNLAAANLVKNFVRAQYDSVDDAKQAIGQVNDVFDSLLAGVDDVDSYMAISEMQTAAVKCVRDSFGNLAVVLDRPVSDTNNILAICYDVYGNLDKVEDLLDRNKISDPMFITPGALKVLSK